MIKKYSLDKESDITDENFFYNRRKIIAASLSTPFIFKTNMAISKNNSFLFNKDLKYSTNEQTNTFKQITSYNNFYELGTGKRDPMINKNKLKTKDWTLTIDGEVENKLVINMEDLIKKFTLEERIYRLRCVEAWSMVIPWIGFEFNKIIKLVKPTMNAKYVSFESIYDPDNLPGQKRNILNWPYKEGLTYFEAMSPLAILSVGLYGNILPKQNGSPIRLVVPWKYGFKSIKSVVKISFTEKKPTCTWNQQAPNEYGFYSNVNPNVSHPRWSQKKERRIGEFVKRNTLMFNGYGDFVRHLYTDIDLIKNF